MKHFKTESLLSTLKKDVEQLQAASQHLHNANAVKLTLAPEQGKWSATQCLEHLNIYNRYYLPAIETALDEAQKGQNAWFNPGTLGNYFTNMMSPKDIYEPKGKMKTFAAFKPAKALNVDAVFSEFDGHQQKLLDLLERAREYDLEAVRIPVSMTKMIKLKLGDTFRFLIAHEQRHMMQARNAIRKAGVPTDKFPVILEAARL